MYSQDKVTYPQCSYSFSNYTGSAKLEEMHFESFICNLNGDFLLNLIEEREAFKNVIF